MVVRATRQVFQNLFIYFSIYFILGVTIKRAAKKKKTRSPGKSRKSIIERYFCFPLATEEEEDSGVVLEMETLSRVGCLTNCTHFPFPTSSPIYPPQSHSTRLPSLSVLRTPRPGGSLFLLVLTLFLTKLEFSFFFSQ